MGIIIPHGRPIKRIILKIDDKGNIHVEAVDLRNFQRIPGQAEMPLPLSALESIYWLSKAITDAMAQTIQNVEKAKHGTEGQVSSENPEAN